MSETTSKQHMQEKIEWLEGLAAASELISAAEEALKLADKNLRIHQKETCGRYDLSARVRAAKVSARTICYDICNEQRRIKDWLCELMDKKDAR